MSEAKIGIILKNGKIAIQMNVKEMTQGDTAILITHLELLKQEILSRFKKGVKII